MIKITTATESDIPVIIQIARKTWPDVYGSIITMAQVNYMLDLFYSTENLQQNMHSGQHFLLAKYNEDAIGFAAFENDYNGTRNTHLHKIYLLPNQQRKGFGKQLLAEVERKAIQHSADALSLNVNRLNPALQFYEKSGFSIAESVDIEIGNNYLMEDYILRKPLGNRQLMT